MIQPHSVTVDAGTPQVRDAGPCALPATVPPPSQASPVMSFESFTGVLASAVGVVMAVSPLLQARRVQQMRDSSEVSVGFFVIIIVGECVWCLRGITTRDLVILIPNVVALVVEAVTLIIVLHFRPRRARGRR